MEGDDGVDQEIMVKIRDAFVARPDHIFLSADYSQMEMRILARVSGDSSLQQFFRDGNDIFNLIARYFMLHIYIKSVPHPSDCFYNSYGNFYLAAYA